MNLKILTALIEESQKKKHGSRKPYKGIVLPVCWKREKRDERKKTKTALLPPQKNITIRRNIIILLVNSKG